MKIKIKKEIKSDTIDAIITTFQEKLKKSLKNKNKFSVEMTKSKIKKNAIENSLVNHSLSYLSARKLASA